jgi:hypothetical protein
VVECSDKQETREAGVRRFDKSAARICGKDEVWKAGGIKIYIVYPIIWQEVEKRGAALAAGRIEGMTK